MSARGEIGGHRDLSMRGKRVSIRGDRGGIIEAIVFLRVMDCREGWIVALGLIERGES